MYQDNYKVVCVLCHFLTVPWVDQRYVIVAFRLACHPNCLRKQIYQDNYKVVCVLCLFLKVQWVDHRYVIVAFRLACHPNC